MADDVLNTTDRQELDELRVVVSILISNALGEKLRLDGPQATRLRWYLASRQRPEFVPSWNPGHDPER